jgi:hypothetical protein
MDGRVIEAAGVRAGRGRRAAVDKLVRGGLVAVPDPDRGLVTALAAAELSRGGIGVHIAMPDAAQAAGAADRFCGLYGALGLTVGCLSAEPGSRVSAYTANVTYGDYQEFVFDYLRDHLAWSLEECVQRGRSAVILDDAETMLARSPHMYITGPGGQVLAEMGPLAYFRGYTVACGLTHGRVRAFPEEGWWFQLIGEQRDDVYGLRDRVLHGEGVRDLVLAAMDTTAERYVRTRQDRQDLWRSLRRLYPASEALRASELPPDALIAAVQKDMRQAYRRREAEFGPATLPLVEQRVIYSMLDQHWREHLAALNSLVHDARTDAEAALPGSVCLPRGAGFAARVRQIREVLAAPRRYRADLTAQARQTYAQMMTTVWEHVTGYLFGLDVDSTLSGLSVPRSATAPTVPPPDDEARRNARPPTTP